MNKKRVKCQQRKLIISTEFFFRSIRNTRILNMIVKKMYIVLSVVIFLYAMIFVWCVYVPVGRYKITVTKTSIIMFSLCSVGHYRSHSLSAYAYMLSICCGFFLKMNGKNQYLISTIRTYNSLHIAANVCVRCE